MSGNFTGAQDALKEFTDKLNLPFEFWQINDISINALDPFIRIAYFVGEGDTREEFKKQFVAPAVPLIAVHRVLRRIDNDEEDDNGEAAE